MPERGVDGVFRTQPIETYHGGGGTLPVAADEGEQDWSGWEKWLAGHLAIEREETNRCIGVVLGELQRKIHDLELRLAEAHGAIDVLRGKGAPGALRLCGTYISDALYLANDVVACNGSSFVALKDRPGPCPGDGWQLLASAGKRGARGERGFQGPRGDAVKVKWLSFDSERLALIITMADASQTTIPLAGIFTGVRIDRADYSIKFSMRDGAELAFSLRELFEQYDDEKRGR